MIHCEFENGNKASLRHVVVDTLVLKKGKLLLVQRAKQLSEGGKWGLVGGYVDRDETVEQAVEREVFEETGYKIADITLLKVISNPNRPHEDRQNISFVFYCKALEKEGESDWEVTDQKWYDFDKLPPKNQIAFDHYDDIQAYLDLKKA
jgi:8-oxo-dGTP diphosphatase